MLATSQEASVFRTISVEDNPLSSLEMTSLSKSEQKYKCDSLIDEFGLSKVRKINGSTFWWRRDELK